MPPHDRGFSPLDILQTHSAIHVQMETAIGLKDNMLLVETRHVYPDGHVVTFSKLWPNDFTIRTEYSSGLSIIHDLKDHYLWGLQISQMAEFQAICQIQIGRAMLRSRDSWREIAMRAIVSEVIQELHLEHRPRVYDAELPGLTHDLSSTELLNVQEVILQFCFELAFPLISDFYLRFPVFRDLQRSIREMPEVAGRFLGGLQWIDGCTQTLRLADNVGITLSNVAYAHSEASEVSREIHSRWRVSRQGCRRFRQPWFDYSPLPGLLWS